MLRTLQDFDDQCDGETPFVIIEKSQAFPDQGAVSNFSTGHGFGLWLGLIVAMGLGHELVRPAVWKKDMGLDKDKKRSIMIAKRLFPVTADLYKVPRGRVDSLDGRAEALLMAEWMRRKLQGESHAVVENRKGVVAQAEAS
jgi:hypothetical protein